MRILLGIFLLLGSAAHAAVLQDVRGLSSIPVATRAGQFFRADNGVTAATLVPRTSAFDWSKISGRWLLQENTDSTVKFTVALDFAYFAGCSGGIGVAEYDGVAVPMAGWAFESKYGPYMYAFFAIGSKFGMLLIQIGEQDAVSAKLTIVSDGKEYPMAVTLARDGVTVLDAHDAQVTSVAPPIQYEDDVYFTEKPILTGGIAFHPKLVNALTCMTDGFMGFSNPNFPIGITTVSVGQKSGAYLIQLTATEPHERDSGKTIMSAATKDLRFWQRYYR